MALPKIGSLHDPGNKAALSNTLSNLLTEILPPDWQFDLVGHGASRGLDGRLRIQPPKGPPALFGVEFKTEFHPRDIDRLERARSHLRGDERLLLAAPWLSGRSRELLRERAICYLDLTRNAWLATDSLVIHHLGADKPPERTHRRGLKTSLRGPTTGRIVRFLTDTPPPYKVREVASETGVHPGNVSRLLQLLERERVVEREPNGSVSSVDWKALIELWAADLAKDRRMEAFLEPRGLEAMSSRLGERGVAYAVTGPFASEKLAPVAASAAIDVYVQDIEHARAALSLRRTERIGNVRLVEAFDRVVFDRTITTDDIVLACPSQIAADLLTLPNRSDDEYSALVRWMSRHEPAWRR